MGEKIFQIEFEMLMIAQLTLSEAERWGWLGVGTEERGGINIKQPSLSRQASSMDYS